MAEPAIVNYIEINGQDVLMDSLSDQQRKEISEMLTTKIIQAARFKEDKRVTA